MVPFISPGNFLAMPELKDDVSENHLWRMFDGIESAKRNGMVSEIKRKGAKHLITITESVNSETQETEDVIYTVPSDQDLNVIDGDIVKAGQTLIKGELFGKGNPFVLLPLFIRYRRYYYHENKGTCSSPDGFKPRFLPPWSNGTENFACSMCPKKQAQKDGGPRCSFFVIVTFLGGPDISTLYKVTLRNTNRYVYSDQMYKVFKTVSYPHSVMFLMDSIPKENDKGQKWWGYGLIDVAKTPDWLIPYCLEAKKVIDSHYKAEDESCLRSRIPRPQAGPTQEKAKYEAPASGGSEWGGEFSDEDADEPPF
jgi:hypothetical protein